MNNTEYNNLLRFENIENIDFDSFKTKLQISSNTMFQIYTIYNQLVYAKVTDEFENLLFDIKQTTPEGEIVPRPLYANSLTKNQIAERIYQGDWRVYN